MGFIDDAAADKIGEILASDAPAEETLSSVTEEPAKTEEVKAESASESANVPEVEPSAPEDSSQAAGDVKQEAAVDKAEPATQEASSGDSPAEEEEEPSGHRVPYNRFKKVIDARNEFKTEADKYKAQVEELEARLKSHSAVQQVQQPVQQKASDDDDAWLKDLLGEDSSSPKVDPSIETLSKRLHETEVHLARQQLEVEINAAVSKYPTATRDVLLHAVAQNPSASVEKVAEQYSSWIAQMEEAAVAKYLADNPQATAQQAATATGTQKASAPPRPKGAGATVATPNTEKRDAPKTVEAASAELRRRWEEINPFAS